MSYATSVLNITDLLFYDVSTNAVLKSTDFNSLTGNNNGSHSVGLNGAGPSNSFNEPLSSGFDLAKQCIGPDCGSAPGENNFGTFPPPPVATYSNADSLLSGTAIDFGGGTTGADAYARADTSIMTPNIFGNATSNLGVTSTFSFTTGASGLAGLGVSFDYFFYAAAFTSGDEVAPGNAFASFNWNVSLAEVVGGLSTQVFSWNPLNGQVSVDAPVNGTNILTNSGSASNESGALLANTEYRLTVSHKVDTTARTAAVPEPGTLALLSLGLIGFGASTRRRIKS
jgi:hypothetical protein